MIALINHSWSATESGNDGKEMAELIKTAKDSGYHVPLNPLWESEVVGIKRSGFTQAKERLAAAFRQG